MKKLDEKFTNDRLDLELDMYVMNSKSWFKVRDVADYLGIGNTSGHITRLVSYPEEHLVVRIVDDITNRKQEMVFIDEYGLYEILVKINKSNAKRYEKAKAFQQWVFGEVLPSIRKNGGYIDVRASDTLEEVDYKVDRTVNDAYDRWEDLQAELEYQKSINNDYSEELNELKTREVYDADLEPVVADLNEEILGLRAQVNKYKQGAQMVYEQYRALIDIMYDMLLREVNEYRMRNHMSPLSGKDKIAVYKEWDRIRHLKSVYDMYPTDRIFGSSLQ